MTHALLNSSMCRFAATAIAVVASLLSADLTAQQPPTRLVPSSTATRPQEPEAQQPEAPSAAELAELKATYDALPPDERAAMVATYKELGIELLKLFGDGAREIAGPPERAASLVDAVRKLDFARTPQKVLDARARLGFQVQAIPPADTPPTELAKWLHEHVLAGDWPGMASFLRERAGDDAAAIYAHVLQSTNQGDPGLLPEEILAIAEAAPGEPTDWQIDLLARLLQAAASKASTGPLLDRLHQGTRLFGLSDDQRRQRTARFLSKAGLAREAYEFLPPLAEARASGDAAAMLAHAQFFASRAAGMGGRPEAEEQRRIAWRLFGEVALMDSADLAVRRESLTQAIDMLPSIPRGLATQWLREVFANPSIASAALEAIALEAMAISDQKADVAQRAQAILTMKESVDTLLEDERVQIDELRVPLRMLTLSLVGAAEEVVNKQAGDRAVSNETALLMRAMPNERWRAQIEPSLVVRAYKAFVGLAVVAGDMDLALDLLAQGVQRGPGQGEELADEFLRLWMQRLRPPARMDGRRGMLIGGEFRDSGLFTRGRQRRNLEVLDRLLEVFDSIDVDGRRLERVVDVFAACHDATETFARADIERVLGPVDELAPAVAARLADTMRRGLGGEWKDAQAQRDKGIKRSQAELDEIVEQGYELALELVNVAMHGDPESWRFAMTRLSLAFDHMQFKRETGRDPGGYAAARAELFRAFAGAAASYRAALARGEIRPDIQLYSIWFSLALGASQLGDLTTENLLTDAVENAAQFDRIREDMLAMPAADASFHIGEFARAISQSAPQLGPDVKAGVMRAAAKLVGDHPAGASLRQTLAIYEDLVHDEVRLRLNLDGSDRVGSEPFGATLTLRATANICKQLDNFEAYLQNDVYVFSPQGGGQRMDHRDRLQRAIERAFDGKVELMGMGFFHSMNPPAPIEVDGESGWEEKPFAYLVLRATDESADHLPLLQFDLTVNDDTGPVVLPVKSNAVLIDAVAGDAPPHRPLSDLDVHLVVDSRAATASDDPVVKLEITAVGEGVVPSLDALLAGLDSALPGYAVDRDDLEVRPIVVGGIEELTRLGRLTGKGDDDTDYVEPGGDGLFRLTTTRSWVVPYRPSAGSAAAGFKLPVLAEGVEGQITAEYYVDFDLVEASGPTVPIVAPSSKLLWLIGLAVALLAGVIGVTIWRRRTHAPAQADELDLHVPDRITPLTAVLTLQRIEREFASALAVDDRARLRAEITALERTYFAEDGSPNGDVRATLERWVTAVRGGP